MRTGANRQPTPLLRQHAVRSKVIQPKVHGWRSTLLLFSIFPARERGEKRRKNIDERSITAWCHRTRAQPASAASCSTPNRRRAWAAAPWRSACTAPWRARAPVSRRTPAAVPSFPHRIVKRSVAHETNASDVPHHNKILSSSLVNVHRRKKIITSQELSI